MTTRHAGLAFGTSRGGMSNGKVRCACAQAHAQQAASLAVPVTCPPFSEPGEVKEESLEMRRPMPKMRLGGRADRHEPAAGWVLARSGQERCCSLQ